MIETQPRKYIIVGNINYLSIKVLEKPKFLWRKYKRSDSGLYRSLNVASPRLAHKRHFVGLTCDFKPRRWQRKYRTFTDQKPPEAAPSSTSWARLPIMLGLAVLDQKDFCSCITFVISASLSKIGVSPKDIPRSGCMMMQDLCFRRHDFLSVLDLNSRTYKVSYSHYLLR